MNINNNIIMHCLINNVSLHFQEQIQNIVRVTEAGSEQLSRIYEHFYARILGFSF